MPRKKRTLKDLRPITYFRHPDSSSTRARSGEKVNIEGAQLMAKAARTVAAYGPEGVKHLPFEIRQRLMVQRRFWPEGSVPARPRRRSKRKETG